MSRQFFRVVTSCLLVFSAVALTLPAMAAERKKFSVCWSIYVGWMPWGFGADQGIVKKMGG